MVMGMSSPLDADGGARSPRPPLVSMPWDDEVLTDVYLEAVRQPGITAEFLVTHGYPEATVTGVTLELQRMGLLRRSGESSWEAIPPDIALPALASQFELRAAMTRALSSELSRIYRGARHRSLTGDGVLVLSSLQEVQDATEQIEAGAEQELVGFYNDSPRTAYRFATDPRTQPTRRLTHTGRHLAVRTTYDTLLLELPRAAEVLQRRSASGEECRFLRGLPFSAIVADSSSAVIDITAFDSSGKGCLWVQDRRLALAVAALAEMLWRMATPMADEGLESVDEQSRAILSLLAGGATDSMIAAQTGISQRTVERKVRTMLSQLGASTRFQAGVQAARRGWL